MKHLDEDTIARLAARLHDAERNAAAIPKLTAEVEGLSLDDAYTIQRGLIALRKLDGEKLIGMKMGLTSRAKMEQMGVHAPIYGHLTSGMVLVDGGSINHKAHCHPRIEPEIAFVLGRPLEGQVSTTEAMLAVDGVCAALEIIDSRYEKFSFTLPDVVADNASSSRFVLGSTMLPRDRVDVANLGMILKKNGRIAETGSSAAIYEHPARSLATLVGLLAERGEGLPAGAVVLAGGATAAIALAPGDVVELDVQSLGRVTMAVR
jgi:2-oxo-3-hexenedioate decarboxylase